MVHDATSSLDRLALALVLLHATLGAVGCGPDACDDDDCSGETSSDTEPDLTSPGAGISVYKDVDILFVIDNSGSMGEEQRRLAADFGAFIDVLEDADMNYRIGVTTSDYGNPRCAPDDFPRLPSQGRFALESCRNRIGLDGQRNDFVSDPEMIDATAACTDYCDQGVHDALQGAWRPTTIEQDDSVAPRLWIDRDGRQLNLPDGVAEAAAGLGISPVEAAFRCLGPQGVNGCGFESQLESMYWALARAEEPGELNYGFLRDAAFLSIIHLTDEADCSFHPSQQNIFLDLNNTWAWEDGATSPTSAVCWNAGVECEGAAPGPYTSCDVVDRDINGGLLEYDSASAVLHPIEKYLSQLNAIEKDKQAVIYNLEVLVSVIGGVPSGYDAMAAELQYIDNVEDPAAQINFGIAPGCVSAGDGGSAIPPVRLRELAEQFAVDGERNIFSACDASYANTLDTIAKRLVDQVEPACFRACVDDAEPETPLLDPTCRVFQNSSATDEVIELHECVLDPDTSEPTPPPGASICFIYLLDRSGETPSALDDMSPKCVDAGWNLEFKLVHLGPETQRDWIGAKCVLSEKLARDCPDL
ncbi:MAG: VWA domain-containing protein [Myxococcales bacterium]|nr:VWA domain-containing protein [Myxococcales bacterium]